MGERSVHVTAVAAGYLLGACACAAYLVWSAKLRVAIATQCLDQNAWECVALICMEACIYLGFGYKFTQNAVRVWSARR